MSTIWEEVSNVPNWPGVALCEEHRGASGQLGEEQHATRIDLAPFFSPARDRGEALESALEFIAIGVRGAS